MSAWCSGLVGSASRPPWTLGWSVTTRWSRIAGTPVSSATSVTGTPRSATALAVPPLDTIRQPRPCSASARSPIPALSYTESNAVGTAATVPIPHRGRPCSERNVSAFRGVGDDCCHQFAGFGGVLADLHARCAEGVHLSLGGALAAGDDRPGVAHLLAGRRRDPGDVGAHRLGHAGLDELGRFLLGRAADLADHHDRVRLGVGLELAQAVDEVRAGHRVAADPDARRHADPLLLELVQRLVGQRARAADDADVGPRAVGSLAISPAVIPMLHLPGLMIPGQLGPSSRVPG